MPIGGLDILSDQGTDVMPDYVEPKNPDAKTHVVYPPNNGHIPGATLMDAQDLVDLARRKGMIVVALCGYKWIPRADPDKLEACQICFDVAAMIMRESGE